MNSTWQDLGYQFHLTDDGSPTLIVTNPLVTDQHASEIREKMHSWEGAFSETVHLYEPAMAKAFAQPSVHLVSVGLGLGYVEILFVCLAIKSCHHNASCESFEKNSLLIQNFLDYVMDKNDLPEEIKKTYDLVFQRFSAHFELSKEIMKNHFQKFLEEKKIVLRDSLESDTRFLKPPTCLIWDAYGRRFHDALWQDECLRNALVQVDVRYAVFASYASFGALKKVLADCGFHNSRAHGYGKKKESSIFFRPETF